MEEYATGDVYFVRADAAWYVDIGGRHVFVGRWPHSELYWPRDDGRRVKVRLRTQSGRCRAAFRGFASD